MHSNPLGLLLRTSRPSLWSVLSAFRPSWTPWLRGPLSRRYDPNDLRGLFLDRLGSAIAARLATGDACHSTLPLTVLACRCSGIYTVILQSLR